jgi:hypothetical protein
VWQHEWKQNLGTLLKQLILSFGELDLVKTLVEHPVCRPRLQARLLGVPNRPEVS